jgi:hypothetical protein
MMPARNRLDFFSAQLANVETGWSLGTFGAIAEFVREAGEAADFAREPGSVSAVTARGGLRIAPCDDLRLVASETPTAESWSHRVALCLPRAACAGSGRRVLTEIGRDDEALREQDRGAVLFDLGLGALQVDCCIRSADGSLVEALRQHAGRSLFDAGNGAMGLILAANPHRVFVTRVGRIEVFAPIPPSDGKSPTGPHTHILPKLLAHGRTHAAGEPVPDGWVPCAHLYPPHPLRDRLGRSRSFQSEFHAAFQTLLANHGDPRLIEFKRRVIEAVAAGEAPAGTAVTGDRNARATLRVALRQMQACGGSSPALAAWLSQHDRFEAAEHDELAEAHP